MKKSKKLESSELLPDREPRIGNPDKGVLLSPLYPDRVGFVCQRAEPRVNEQGALEVCAAVVTYLNRRGANFEVPTVRQGQENGVDCVSYSPDETLNFQVTRALQDSDFWRYLGANKGVMAYRERPQFADDLWDAILHKAKRTPPIDCGSITLVLDSTDLFAHHSESTVKDFLLRHSSNARSLGFSSIWVAADHALFVHQLV